MRRRKLREGELQRAIRVAKSEGLEVASIEVEDGRFVIVTCSGHTEEQTPLDRWLAGRAGTTQRN